MHGVSYCDGGCHIVDGGFPCDEACNRESGAADIDFGFGAFFVELGMFDLYVG